jgi:hypothetical protein
MNILEIDGVPVPLKEPMPTSASKKVRILQAANEDFEWYPTTDEILAAFAGDLYSQAKTLSSMNDNKGIYHDKRHYDSETGTHHDLVSIENMLDVGAGDGRVFNAIKDKNRGLRFRIEKKYGIEIANSQSDDLIRKGVFIIGRDFFQTSLIDKNYAVIFSNPPYSIYEDWTLRLLRESSFTVMYLVLPVRWETNKEILYEMTRFDYENIGEYDFSHGERAARARVNLIRIRNKTREYKNYRGFTYTEYAEQDPFIRWIEKYIGTFDEVPEKEVYDYEEEGRFLALKRDNDIDQLVDDYAAGMNSLLEGMKAVKCLPSCVTRALKIDKKSLHETIKQEIAKMKKRYWRLAFGKLDAVTERLTYDTRDKLLGEMEEFKSLDFNAGNIRSIVIWIIEHHNGYTKEQTVDLFENLAEPDYIRTYKSNTHWNKDTWRYSHFAGKYPNGKPEKYMLDYRFVARSRIGYRGYGDKSSVVDDLIVVLRSLGADISRLQKVDATIKQKKQEVEFYNQAGQKTETAFECRFYKNGNVHLKVNQALMTKFNVEVARILGWVRGPEDIQNEFEVSEEEAAGLWNKPALVMLGRGDIPLLEFKEGAGKKDHEK